MLYGEVCRWYSVDRHKFVCTHVCFTLKQTLNLISINDEVNKQGIINRVLFLIYVFDLEIERLN